MQIATHNFLRNSWLITRCHKPIGTILLLWPTLMAIIIETKGKIFNAYTPVFIFGVIIMRAAGCTINDIFDRNIDPHVTRTKDRPLASKAMSTKQALYLLFILHVFALLLAVQLPYQAWPHILIALCLSTIYPLCKRFIQCPQLILGIAFAWSIPIIAVTYNNTVSHNAWLLLGLTIIWTVTYDTIYAMCDKQDDIKIGVKSFAVLLGKYDTTCIKIGFIIIICGWFTLTQQINKQISYWFYLVFLPPILINMYQQMNIIQKEDSKQYMQAFKLNGYLGFIFCISISTLYLI